MLKSSYCEVTDVSEATNVSDAKDIIREIGVDEAGRGPMIGRVYTAAVLLPPSMEDFNHALMKDSKKFHSEKKIKAAAAYIKEKAIAWAIAYRAINHILNYDANGVDTNMVIGKSLIHLEGGAWGGTPLLLVDGNDFTPFILKSETKQERVQHVCIEGGDNAYSCIAAASILAKVARDEYIAELCTADPSLITKYDLLKNKGYGTKKHMDGIRAHGITPYHRKTFGLCKEFV